MLESVSLKVFMFLTIEQFTSLLYVHETTKTCPDVDITATLEPPKIRREGISLIYKMGLSCLRSLLLFFLV